nr:hypothetical protein Iba_chr10bCG9630 [Ipomoea batatas]GMD47244.1 hypothetical protein Iba_chr10eCG11050 [Ipomoea batatas]
METTAPSNHEGPMNDNVDSVPEPNIGALEDAMVDETITNTHLHTLNDIIGLSNIQVVGISSNTKNDKLERHQYLSYMK